MTITVAEPRDCVRGHSAALIETRPDGTTICTGCRDEFLARKNAARRVNTNRRRARKGATPHGSTYGQTVRT